jgi:ubiquinone/menaquinone biosynthesis C-methylase UbiE
MMYLNRAKSHFESNGIITLFRTGVGELASPAINSEIRMSTYQVPYDRFADQFDRGRELSTAKQVLWLGLFEKYLGLGKSSRVLDVGCGTGRFSILIANHFECSVVGIDPSASMLTKARAKCPKKAEWLRGMGEAMPFSESAFDICLASQVVQHFQDKLRAFGEIYRVLQTGGKVGLRISSHAQLETILDYRFFPSGLPLERERLPDIHVVKEMLLTAGFGKLEAHTVRQPLFESADDYLAKLYNKYASFLLLISEEEYQKGLREAAEYLRKHKPAADKYAEITFLVGCK